LVLVDFRQFAETFFRLKNLQFGNLSTAETFESENEKKKFKEEL